MPKHLVVLNLGLAAICIVFVMRIVDSAPRGDSSIATVPRAVVSASPGAEPVVRAESPGLGYDVVVSRSLFHPTRAEPRRTESGPAAPPAEKPVLYGVVVAGESRLAYLQDPVTKRILGYKPGDKIGDGQLTQVESDRVVISRADGPLEILLSGPGRGTPGQARSTTPVQVVQPEPVPPADLSKVGVGSPFR